MVQTTNLQLPYIMAAQAQKHVTHNEAIRALDALVQISVIDRDLTAAPGAPADGDRYIVAIGATGVWAGMDGRVAAYQDNAWMYYNPRTGWLAWVADEGLLYVYGGANWSAYSGSGLGGTTTIINTAPNGAATSSVLAEEELTLSGAFVDSTVLIPDRAIVSAVTTRTTQAITGATSFDCGISGETGKYGAALGIALGATNSGVIGPTAFYTDTPVRLTANGGNFTGGKVRIAIHYMLCAVPTS